MEIQKETKYQLNEIEQKDEDFDENEEDQL